MMKNRLVFAGSTSTKIQFIPPTMDSSMTTPKMVAVSASKTPARISFPQGAGKCPII